MAKEGMEPKMPWQVPRQLQNTSQEEKKREERRRGGERGKQSKNGRKSEAGVWLERAEGDGMRRKEGKEQRLEGRKRTRNTQKGPPGNSRGVGGGEKLLKGLH